MRTKIETSCGIELLEICIKDSFFSRRDMHKFINKEKGQAVFVGKVLNWGGIKLTVTGIIIKSYPERSGYITPSTVIIFRSQCTHMMLLL